MTEDFIPLDMNDVDTIACVGIGTIGGGWAAYFLARGYRVKAWDPAPDAEPRLRRLIDAAWPALTQLGLAPNASKDNITVHTDLAETVADAGFVQESAPEVLELKQSLLAQIDAVTPPDVVIASSTSGYGMTEMATKAKNPSRLVV
jgi:carnitine 3-dehydrogenase